MRVSKRPYFPAYLRMLAQLERFGILERDLPPRFYDMHWSGRRAYLQANYPILFMCPRCRVIIGITERHRRVKLCQQCGEHTAHHTIEEDDAEVLGAGHEIPSAVASKSELLRIAPTIIQDSTTNILAAARKKEKKDDDQ